MFTVKFIFSFSFVLQLLLDIGHYNFQFFILFKVMYRRDGELKLLGLLLRSQKRLHSKGLTSERF